MNEIILHHYPASPYSEKLRKLLGFKGLEWGSVITPFMMPKPLLMPLTGGYRKAPVLQIGCDVFCDSAMMVKVIEHLHPEPTLIPAGQEASCEAFAALEQSLFFGAVATNFLPEGVQGFAERLGPQHLQAFAADRAALFTGGTAQRPGKDFAATHFQPMVAALDAQLAQQPYLLGSSFSLADLACYHPVWFVLANKGVAPRLAGFKNLMAWAERIVSMGQGRPHEVSGEEALAVSRQCQQPMPLRGALLLPTGFKLGDAVAVHATDYGCDAVRGTLVHSSAEEFVLVREDELAGGTRLHVPRRGFALGAA